MPEILGHDQVWWTLMDALKCDRLHHAWIFSGPVGVGKCTTAVELAKVLLDPGAAERGFDPPIDPASRTTQLIEAGTHPDLHVIRKELALYSDNPALRERKLTNLPLDLLRERVIGGKTSDDRRHEPAAYRTAIEGHQKVFIIDEAELLDPTAQNALLKTLEEPPRRTFFFLITCRPGRLLPTIHSRCQHLRFGRLDEASMTCWLNGSGLDIAEETRTWMTRFADGSPGVAQLAVDHDLYRWHQTLAPLLEQASAGRFPDTLGETMAELVNGFAEACVKAQRQASKDAANKAGARHLLHLLTSECRQRLAAQCEIGGDVAPWPEVIDLVRECELQLEANVNMKHAFGNLAVQWTRQAALVTA